MEDLSSEGESEQVYLVVDPDKVERSCYLHALLTVKEATLKGKAAQDCKMLEEIYTKLDVDLIKYSLFKIDCRTFVIPKMEYAYLSDECPCSRRQRLEFIHASKPESIVLILNKGMAKEKIEELCKGLPFKPKVFCTPEEYDQWTATYLCDVYESECQD